LELPCSWYPPVTTAKDFHFLGGFLGAGKQGKAAQAENKKQPWNAHGPFIA
jgi:hypothetical protein